MCLPLFHKWKVVDAHIQESFTPITYFLLVCQNCGAIKNKKLYGAFGIEKLVNQELEAWFHKTGQK